MNTTASMESIPTPALVVDLPTVQRNITAMAGYAREHRLSLRPHTKTHKSRRIARMQTDAGFSGLTVAKPGEARVMAQVCDDLLIAYPAFDAARAPVVAELARERVVRVAIDSPEAADRLADAAQAAGATIGILIDYDAGFHRTGVQTPVQTLELAQRVSRHRSLRLDGLMFFPGHLFLPPDRQREPLAALSATLDEILDLWSRSGLSAPIVSGGSTPTATQSHWVRSLTELRPGTYVYNDMNCVAGGYCAIDDCAARVYCTVISTAVPGKCVIDAGSKTLTSDRRAGDPEKGGFGHVIERPNARLVRLSEEHGEIDLDGGPPPPLGSRLTIIPNHICPCVNLHDQVWFREEDGRLTSDTVDARGRVQ